MNREKIVNLAKRCGAYVYKDGDAVFDSTEDIEIFYHAAIADFLQTSGQYVTNDASREACIKQAKAEAFELAVVKYEGLKAEAYEVFGFNKHEPMKTMLDQQVVDVIEWYDASIREMAKGMK